MKYNARKYNLSNLDSERKLYNKIFNAISQNRNYNDINLSRSLDNIKKTYGDLIDTIDIEQTKNADIPPEMGDKYNVKDLSFFAIKKLFHKYFGYYDILAPYDDYTDIYDRYVRIFNNLFGNIRFKIIINQIYEIASDPDFINKSNNDVSDRSKQKVDSIINDYISEIFSTNEIFTFILFFKMNLEKDGTPLLDVLNLEESDMDFNYDGNVKSPILLNDYVDNQQELINSTKIPVKYLVMLNVFLKSFLSLVLKNFDSSSELRNLVSIFMKGSGVKYTVIGRLISESLHRVFGSTMKKLVDRNEMLRSTDDDNVVMKQLYDIIINDDQYIFIDDTKKLSLKLHYRRFIILLKDFVASESVFPLDQAIIYFTKKNKIVDIEMLENDENLKMRLEISKSLLSFLESGNKEEIFSYLCNNKEKVERTFKGGPYRPSDQLFVLESLELDSLLATSDMLKELEQLNDRIGDLARGLELPEPDFELCRADGSYAFPVTEEQKPVSVDGNFEKPVIDEGNFEKPVMDEGNFEGFTNSSFNTSKILNIFIVISLVIFMIVGYFYLNRNSINNFVLSDTPHLDSL